MSRRPGTAAHFPADGPWQGFVGRAAVPCRQGRRGETVSSFLLSSRPLKLPYRGAAAWNLRGDLRQFLPFKLPYCRIGVAAGCRQQSRSATAATLLPTPVKA